MTPTSPYRPARVLFVEEAFSLDSRGWKAAHMMTVMVPHRG